MTSKERVISIYEDFKNLYGEEFANYMIRSVLYGEELFYDLSFDEATTIYKELTK